MIRFTVATVCYNASSTLRRTLQSVVTQDYPHIEHLIIDGASKDDTAQLVQQYLALYEGIEDGRTLVFRSEPDKGLYDAMNKALLQATGDYILFLNAGDKFHTSTTLSDIAAQLPASSDRNTLPAVLYGDTHLVDDNGTFLRARRLSPPEQLHLHDFVNGMLVCHQAFFRPHRPGPHRTLQSQLSLLGRLRLVHPLNATSRATRSFFAQHSFGRRRLSQRRPHHPPPQSLPPRTFSHHGTPLWSVHRARSPRLVCDSRIDQTMKSHDFESLYRRASAYCARRETCRGDLEKKFRAAEIEPDLIDRVLDRLEQEKFIDEQRYAHAFVHDKAAFARWGRLKIRNALRLKGIDKHLIDIALEEEIDEKTYRQTLRELLSAKLRSLKFDPSDRRASYLAAQKLARFAASRGFEAEAVFREIEHLNRL